MITNGKKDHIVPKNDVHVEESTEAWATQEIKNSIDAVRLNFPHLRDCVGLSELISGLDSMKILRHHIFHQVFKKPAEYLLSIISPRSDNYEKLVFAEICTSK